MNADLNKGTISGEVTIDRYTITLAVLFMLQLVFCFCIVGYTNNRVRDAELRNEKQKAEFYKFIYQFNKQMNDEADVNLRNIRASTTGAVGATPGGPGKMD